MALTGAKATIAGVAGLMSIGAMVLLVVVTPGRRDPSWYNPINGRTMSTSEVRTRLNRLERSREDQPIYGVTPAHGEAKATSASWITLAGAGLGGLVVFAIGGVVAFRMMPVDEEPEE